MTLILSGTDGLSDVDGSASTPAIRGTDTNTGIFFPAADTIAFAEGGAEAMRIDSSANVGIGTTSPGVSGLEISRATGSASPTPAEVRISTSSSASDWSTTLPWGRMSFYSADTSDSGPKIQASIDTIAEATSGGLSSISFKTATITTGTLTERMRIDSSGNVGIGTSSPGAKLHVNVGTNQNIRLSSGGTDDARIACLNDAASATVQLSMQGSPLLFRTAGGAEAMRIDSSGAVGIGVTPSAWGSTWKALQISSWAALGAETSSSGECTLLQNAYASGTSTFKYISSFAATRYTLENSEHKWFTAPSGTAGNTITWTERARITSGGIFLVGKTVNDEVTAGTRIGDSGTTCSSSGTTNFWVAYSTTANAYRFYISQAGTVFATNTTISAISDQRYKENIRDLDVGLDAVMQLRPRKFDWKEGKGQNTKNARGFIAQEFEQVFPDLVDEWKDPAPEGEEPYKSVRQDLIPVLVKAIQELKAELDTVKAQNAAFEARLAALEAK
jgi:hypothetical protein